MIRLATVIENFEADYPGAYGDSILPSQRKALSALKTCRTSAAALMQARCEACDHVELMPHSCGHRSCPYCQHHVSQRWIERQLARQVPAEYFLIAFTLPASLRALAWANQRTVYDLHDPVRLGDAAHLRAQ